MNPVDLEGRLCRLHRSQARRALVDRLCEDRVPREAAILVLDAFRLLGVTQQVGRLQRIVLSDQYRPFVRALALNILLLFDREAALELPLEMSPDDAEAILLATVSSIVHLTVADAKGCSAIAVVLQEVPEEARYAAFEFLDANRAREGIPATVLYRELLTIPSLQDLRPAMLARLVDEGGADARALLEELRDAATEPDPRREYQGALLRLLTEEIRPDREPTTAEGWGLVSTCDRLGTFTAASCVRSSAEGWVVAGVTLRVTGDVQDGLLVPGSTEEDADRACDDVVRSTGSPFTRVPLPYVAALVSDGVDRSRDAGHTLPQAAWSAVGVIDRFRDPDVALQRPDPTDPEPTPADVDALLERPEYRDRWYFDEGDLLGARARIPEGAGVPPEREAEWLAETAALLDSPGLRGRLAAMCRHMACWHTWAKQPDLAALLASLADLCARRFADNPLVQAMLRRSLVLVRPRDFFVPTIGDPALRQRLRDTFMPGLKLPRGTDLAVLDFAEIAFLCLESLCERLPGERRPRRDQVEEAAFAVGDAWARNATARAMGRGILPRAQVLRQMTADIGECLALPRHDAQVLAEEVQVGLATFASQVCSSCPVRCLREPLRAVMRPFYQAEHPGLGVKGR